MSMLGQSQSPTPEKKAKPFLGIRFIRCGVYGRLYPNREGTAYVGRCPRCGASLRLAIGKGGTSERFFIAECP